MFTLLNIEAHRFGSVEENRLWHPISININLRIKNKRVKEQALDKGSQVELRGDSLLPLNLHYDVGIQLSSKEGALVTISCELIYLSWPHLVIQSVTQAPFAWEHYVSLFESVFPLHWASTFRVEELILRMAIIRSFNGEDKLYNARGVPFLNWLVDRGGALHEQLEPANSIFAIEETLCTYSPMSTVLEYLREPFLQISSIIFLAIILKYYFILKKKPTFINLPPSPPKLPIIGNLHQFGTTSSPHISLLNLSRKYGPIFYLNLGHIPTVIISSAKLAKEAFKTHDLAFASRPRNVAAEYLFYKSTDMVFSPYGAY
ncbi:hypothetical protein G4B88_013391 [Cannabis sativa]|uniref:Cytochrome P450 n=1 Tax=Cannabis sativa TaxID=3483 RepID=A0A7J6FJ25_CANSA|nr:hypothetical protein G4B88_013391 [Cannabis sativa]